MPARDRDLNEIRVSVIVSTYNRFDRLVVALRGVRAQTHRNLEVIVVNDGSTEPAYAEAPRGKDVTWIDLDRNTRFTHGFPCLGHVRNVAMRRARGEYLAFLDDDDLWEPDKLHRQLHAVHGSPFSMCTTEAWAGDGRPDSRIEYPRFYAGYLGVELPDELTAANLAECNYVTHSSVLLRRDVAERAGPFPELPLQGIERDGRWIVEDWEMWRRCLQLTRCRFLREPLVYYDCKSGLVDWWSMRMRLRAFDLGRALGRAPHKVPLRHGKDVR